MSKKFYIMAAGLLIGSGYAGMAEAKCLPGQVKIGNVCVGTPTGPIVHDHRCVPGNGGVCVEGQDSGPVVAPPPPPPRQPPVGTGPVVVGQPPIVVDHGPSEPPANEDSVTCDEGESILQSKGYKHIDAIDCVAPVFKYTAAKHHKQYLFKIRDDGKIIAKIRTD